MELKQVIIVRKDLKLPKGKLCIQVAHASLSAYLETLEKNPEWAKRWLESGQKKILVKVNNLKELFERMKMALELGIPVFLVRDAGLTVLDPGTITCLGIGPGPSHIIDKVTGDLKLV